MKVLLIAGRVSVHAWTAGAIVLDIARGLSERGHEVSLLAESLEDANAASCCTRVDVKSPFAETGSDFPLAFGGWASRAARRVDHDVALSTTRALSGDVWLPLEPTARAWLATRSRGLLRLAPALLKHHGVVARAFREMARATARGSRPSTLLAVGEVASSGAAIATPGVRVRTLDYFSAGPPHAATSDDRARVRSLLGLSERRTVLLLPVTARPGAWLRPVMDEIAATARSPSQTDRAANTALLVVCEEQFPVHEMALRAGCDQQVRVIGLTSRPWAALAASDAVVLAAPCPGGPWACGATGRFAADALAAGKPLLAHSLSSGAELARRLVTVEGTPMSPGLAVDHAPGSWRRAIRQTADTAWLERASAAARAIGARLTRNSMVEAVEAALVERGPRRA